MNPQQLMKEGREMLVGELNLGHLAVEQQDEILDGLGEVLMQRVLLKLLELMPESERENFGKLFAEQKGEEMQTLVEKFVPNSADVIKAEFKAGIEEHKRLIHEEAQRETGEKTV